MGALTPIDKVWYPDETDADQPNIYMATHSQSIEEGIGARLRYQEVAAGLKAGLTAQFGLKNTLTTVPFQVSNGFANFAQGMSIEGGVVTIQTPGMYLVTGSVGITTVAGDSIVTRLYKGGTAFASTEVPSDASKYAVGQCTCVINCVAGDTISVSARNGKPGTTSTTPVDQTLTYISIAMVQAVPA